MKKDIGLIFMSENVVSCDTIEQIEQLLTVADNYNYTWLNGRKLFDTNIEKLDKMCFRFSDGKVGASDKRFYISILGYDDIIEFGDIEF